MMRRKGRSRRYAFYQQGSEISLTPLIDTALTLLIIFMIATPMIQNSIKIDLPKGNAQEDQNNTQELVVYLDKAGRYYCDEKPYDLQNLIAIVTQRVAAKKDQTIFIKADQAVSYGTVIDLVDRIKHIEGVGYVAMAMEKRT
jgi:biopolymer transport protein ExbD